MELAATLANLAEEGADQRVSMQALRLGAEPIRSSAARRAPRRAPTPDLADNIVIAPLSLRDDETAAVKLGPARGFAYGVPEEYGTYKHRAQPFLRPAFDSKWQESLERIRASYWAVLAKRGVSRSVSVPSFPSSPGGGGLL